MIPCWIRRSSHSVAPPLIGPLVMLQVAYVVDTNILNELYFNS